jgi:hypothetical protein
VTGGSARAGHQGDVPAARPGKGHLAAAPDPSPSFDESRADELCQVLGAASDELLEGRGVQNLRQAIELASSMDATETVFAAVGQVSFVSRNLKEAEDQLQTAKAQIAALTETLSAARAEAAVARERLYRKDRDRPTPKHRAMPPPADDVAGQDRRPDPETARTPAELMGTLREFRQWAGTPSYRLMAERSGWGASTLNTIINSTELPDRLAKIDAVLTGCGAGKKDHERFASAWRRLSMPGTPARAIPQDPPHLALTPFTVQVHGDAAQTLYTTAYDALVDRHQLRFSGGSGRSGSLRTGPAPDSA